MPVTPATRSAPTPRATYAVRRDAPFFGCRSWISRAARTRNSADGIPTPSAHPVTVPVSCVSHATTRARALPRNPPMPIAAMRARTAQVFAKIPSQWNSSQNTRHNPATAAADRAMSGPPDPDDSEQGSGDGRPGRGRGDPLQPVQRRLDDQQVDITPEQPGPPDEQRLVVARAFVLPLAGLPERRRLRVGKRPGAVQRGQHGHAAAEHGSRTLRDGLEGNRVAPCYAFRALRASPRWLLRREQFRRTAFPHFPQDFSHDASPSLVLICRARSARSAATSRVSCRVSSRAPGVLDRARCASSNRSQSYAQMSRAAGSGSASYRRRIRSVRAACLRPAISTPPGYDEATPTEGDRHGRA